MKLLIAIAACGLSCVACTPRSIAPPPERPQGVVQFAAWYAANSVEVPLQGVVRLQHVDVSGGHLEKPERLGLVMSHGATVGVSVWGADGSVQRKTGDIPGMYGLLLATERCAMALLRLRGIAVPDAPPTDATEEAVGAQDALGPLERLCRKDGAQVVVRITKEQR